MTSTYLDHVSHEHPLLLIDDFDSSSIAAPLKCYLCKIPIIGVSAAYMCSREDSSCPFYLHKRCAESPKQINFFYSLTAEWQLVLNIYHSAQRPVGRVRANGLLANSALCRFCSCEIKENMWAYFYSSYEVCVRCAAMELLLSHEGHQQHSLTLLRSEACFKCNACGIKAEEPDSYICHTCHYWIHSSCASSPRTITLRIHEDDTLKLIYSIPKLYQRFVKHCPICTDKVEKNYWTYFCEESGYFVHIKCATKLLASGKNVIEKEVDDGLTFPDLMQFPRPTTSSLVMDLMAQYRSDKPIDTITIIDKVDNEKEDLVIHHWSHPEHPLILLEEMMNADNSDSDDYIADDDNEEEENDTKNHTDGMLVCNGCVHPISTVSSQHYYGCIGCNFFLHASCANYLTCQSPLGKCPIFPEDALKLCKSTRPYKTTMCEACYKSSNGFMYECEMCYSSNIDICCSLAPHRIKYDYHKHPLVQRDASKKNCNACLESIYFGLEYGCETCSNIQIHQSCALSFPKTISHRWDSHSISLIYPPIYYKGLRYCEICELEVNQEAWLYLCRKCNQCFHPLCIRSHNVKVGNTIDPSTHNLHPHTLTLNVIDQDRYAYRVHEYISCDCKLQRPVDGFSGKKLLYLECAGCNYRLCETCAHELLPRVVPERLYMN